MARYDSGLRFDSGVRFDQPDAPPTRTSTMRDLENFLRNPFDDDGISLDELLAFTTDHLQRLVVKNTGGQWNTFITATTVALTTLGQCSNNDQVKYGTRRAAKLAKEQFRAALPGNIGRLHGAVAYKFGPNSTQMLDCFPDGRTPLDRSTDDALANLLAPLATKLTALAGQLGPEPGSDAGGLLSTWIALHAASDVSTAQKAGTESEKRAARKALQHQLFLNLLAIAELLENQPAMLGEYMQQSLLKDHTATVPPISPPTP